MHFNALLSPTRAYSNRDINSEFQYSGDIDARVGFFPALRPRFSLSARSHLIPDT